MKTVFFNLPAHGHINPSLPLVRELVAREGVLVASKGEGRRAQAQGGLYVNGEPADDARTVGPDDLLAGRFVLLRKGKKAYAVAVLVP